MIPHVPLAPEIIATAVGWPITNTFLNAIGALMIFLFIAALLKNPRPIPGRFQAACEMILEGLFSLFDRVTGNPEKTRKFFPIIGTLFLFILVSNWMGILPGVGSIGVWHVVDEVKTLIPVFRPANSDLNLTLAMALISVVGSHMVGVTFVGFWKQFGRFLPFVGLWQAIKRLNVLAIFIALIELLVGVIEIIGEFAKVISLSLRLFGNIFVGEVLLTVMGALAAFLIPLPFLGLEIIVGAVQAIVFSVLTAVYFSMMSTAPHGSDHTHEKTDVKPKKRMPMVLMET